ncbi:MAG: CDP-alcohol phosphatidyltransferase family protein [Candidatus Hodarchaeota archaeon]
MSEREVVNNKRTNQRKILDRFIDLPVKYLIKHKFTPNILSYIGFLFSVGVAFFLAIDIIHKLWLSWIIPFLMFWAGAFDVFDGEVARRTNNLTKSGAFLDSNLDRLSDAIIILGLIFSNLINFVIGYIMLFLVIMISYIRARAENEGIEMRGVGFMERAERLILMWFAFIAEFFIYYFTDLFFGSPFTWFFPIFILFYIGLLIMTVIQRLIFSFKSLNRNEAQNIE